MHAPCFVSLGDCVPCDFQFLFHFFYEKNSFPKQKPAVCFEQVFLTGPRVIQPMNFLVRAIK